MTASPGSPPPAPPNGDAGSTALLAAMETAPAAVYFLTGPGCATVWANARARALGTAHADLPVVGGHPLADLVQAVVRTGHPETVQGTLAGAGTPATAVLRPMQVDDAPGVLLILESHDGVLESAPWPTGEADVVEKVQHSLLPPSLPLLPDLMLSGSYRRASSVRAAGGDWYDAVALGNGRIALVVGDAVGHGVPAAGAMSRLRGAMRASALRDPAPDAVLMALDAFAAQMEDVEGASVFYAVLDAASGRLRYAAAGHPAPLVMGPDGAADLLPLVPRPPLGSVPGSVTEVHEHLLEPGATLILFSNGAVTGGSAGPADARDRLGGGGPEGGGGPRG